MHRGSTCPVPRKGGRGCAQEGKGPRWPCRPGQPVRGRPAAAVCNSNRLELSMAVQLGPSISDRSVHTGQQGAVQQRPCWRRETPPGWSCPSPAPAAQASAPPPAAHVPTRHLHPPGAPACSLGLLAPRKSSLLLLTRPPRLPLLSGGGREKVLEHRVLPWGFPAAIRGRAQQAEGVGKTSSKEGCRHPCGPARLIRAPGFESRLCLPSSFLQVHGL